MGSTGTHQCFFGTGRRGHIFQRALNGVWACTNNACIGRKETCLEDANWQFGKIFLERRTKCNKCNSPVFELVQCIECGEVHLSAVEANEEQHECLRPFVYAQDEDEFQQELDPLDEDEEKEDWPDSEDQDQKLRRLLVGPGTGASPPPKEMQGGPGRTQSPE